MRRLSELRVPVLVAGLSLKDAGSGGRQPVPDWDAGEEAAEAVLRLPGDQESARCVVSAQAWEGAAGRPAPPPGASAVGPALGSSCPRLPSGSFLGLLGP